MSRVGVVLAVEGDHARIETSRRGICDGCADQKSCAVDAGTSQSVSEEVTARNPLRAKPGDQVEFELPGHTELKISLLVWIVPLVGLLTGAAVGASVHEAISMGRDAATLVGLVLGGAIAFGIVVLFDRRARGHADLVPGIVKILSSEGCSLPDHASHS